MSGPVVAQDGCTVPADLLKLQAPLPKLSRAVLAEQPVRIVALGSSSTSGTGASSRDRTYPARLERELRAVWPENDVHVINAGVGGQLARHMLARIDHDVLKHRPQLVMWQTGVNDAVRGVPLDRFKTELREGIAKMRGAGADVALIDQQYYPRFQRIENGPAYLAAVREVAKEANVPVVQRYRIMQHLIESAQFTAATLLAPDQFHLNDTSYGCLGHLLARSLRSAAQAVAVPAPKLQDAVNTKDEAQM
ncbi:SGNH/GDSL hydrolase family protein [Hyphomicrobium nitrativorans]|uniref:SGNH/GDSL hydrolase family protein n=1 Tax=Hyphomicrobium nitrativorans TaxID=1427356 RepID=UPI00130E1EF9|nr:GDSL-type esterase/lipase family protein [Hyphomicrobium nitrativorans]